MQNGAGRRKGNQKGANRDQNGAEGSPKETKRKPKWSQHRSWDGLPWAPKGGRRVPQGLSKNIWGILGTLRDPPDPPWKLWGVKRKSFWRKNCSRATFVLLFLLEKFRLAFLIDSGKFVRRFWGLPTLTIVWFLLGIMHFPAFR